MENQSILYPSWSQKLLTVIIVLIITFAISTIFIRWHQRSDPYIQQVLSIEGDMVNGREIFKINCAACHGLKANGNVGPSLRNVSKRKSKIQLIDRVISGKTPPMPKFQPTPQEMADLLSYLEQID